MHMHYIDTYTDKYTDIHTHTHTHTHTQNVHITGSCLSIYELANTPSFNSSYRDASEVHTNNNTRNSGQMSPANPRPPLEPVALIPYTRGSGTCGYVCMCICLCVCMCVCVYTYIYTYMHTYIYIYIYIYIYWGAHVCVYMCVYVCVYICMC